MSKINKSRFRIPVAAVFALCATAAHADLTLLGPQDFQGTGLGAVNTILTIQSPGSSSVETGTVFWNGTTDIISGSQVMTGSSQTQTRTLGELGVTSAADLRVVFNALEPGASSGQGSIELNTLAVSFYSTSGLQLYSAGLDRPYAFADTFTGAGNSGFVFALTATQAAEAQAAVFGGAFSNVRVGLYAEARMAEGGLETFFVANAPGVTAPIPEPETYALMMAGLGAMGFVARRRKLKSTKS